MEENKQVRLKKQKKKWKKKKTQHQDSKGARSNSDGGNIDTNNGSSSNIDAISAAGLSASQKDEMGGLPKSSKVSVTDAAATSVATKSPMPSSAVVATVPPSLASMPTSTTTPSSDSPPTARQLHVCASPWRAGIKSAPVQLCSPNVTQDHHRAILAILNRITDTKMEIVVQKAKDLLLQQQKTGGPASENILDAETTKNTTIIDYATKINSSDDSSGEQPQKTNASNCGKMLYSSVAKNEKICKSTSKAGSMNEHCSGDSTDKSENSSENNAASVVKSEGDVDHSVTESKSNADSQGKNENNADSIVKSDALSMADSMNLNKNSDRNNEENSGPDEGINSDLKIAKLTEDEKKQHSINVYNTSDTRYNARDNNTGDNKASSMQVYSDFLAMLFEKAQDEEIYTADYCSFLQLLSSAVLPHALSGAGTREETATRAGDEVADEKEDAKGIDIGGENSGTQGNDEVESGMEDPKKLDGGGIEKSGTQGTGEEQIGTAEDLQELINVAAVGRFRTLHATLSTLYVSPCAPWSGEEEKAEYRTRERVRVHLKFVVALYQAGLLPLETVHLMRDTIAAPLENRHGLAAAAALLQLQQQQQEQLQQQPLQQQLRQQLQQQLQQQQNSDNSSNTNDSMTSINTAGSVAISTTNDLTTNPTTTTTAGDDCTTLTNSSKVIILEVVNHINPRNDNQVLRSSVRMSVQQRRPQEVVGSQRIIVRDAPNNLQRVSLEMLAVYLSLATPVNGMDVTRTEFLCSLLRSHRQHLSVRQQYLVQRTLGHTALLTWLRS